MDGSRNRLEINRDKEGGVNREIQREYKVIKPHFGIGNLTFPVLFSIRCRFIIFVSPRVSIFFSMKWRYYNSQG